MPCCEAARSVTAMATQTWANCAFVVKVLEPLSTQWLSFEDGFGAGAGGVGAGFGFGERPAADPFAGSQFGDVLLPLLVAAGS